MKNEVVVKKASGETELFDFSKLNASLESAGADANTINEIPAIMDDWVYIGVATQEIYAYTYKMKVN